MVLVFEKERGSKTVTTEVPKEEIAIRLASINNGLVKELADPYLTTQTTYFSPEYAREVINWFKYIRPVIESSMKKKIAHICGITDII